MKNAVRDAGIQPTDVGYVNAHGTSTPIGDTLVSQFNVRLIQIDL